MVSFQENGLFSATSYMNHTDGIGARDLEEFTVCVRLRIFYLRGRESNFMSYANRVFDEALTGAFFQLNHETPLKIRFCMAADPKKLCLYSVPEEFSFNKWHQVCYAMSKRSASAYQAVGKLYVDGNLQGQGNLLTELRRN